MRALIVTSMWPGPEAPARGSFVRDQVDALRRLPGVDVEVFAFPPKGYAGAAGLGHMLVTMRARIRA